MIRGPRECRVLYEMGELGEDEIAELMPRWREDYEKAQQPSFFYCMGPGRFLERAAARREHCRWAGIPREHIKQWNAERARRSKTVRKLTSAAQPGLSIPH
jgi:hypothetical protein